MIILYTKSILTLSDKFEMYINYNAMSSLKLKNFFGKILTEQEQ